MTEEAVKFINFSFKYPGSKIPALKNINLSIREGSIVGIIGPTGSGKSTLIKALNGLVPKATGGIQEGDVVVDGLNTRHHEIAELARHVGVVLDDPFTQIFSLTVWDDVCFGPSNLGIPSNEIMERAIFALKATGLNGYETRNPIHMSGGEQQRLAIAGILAMMPKILAFDEPLAMLDPQGKEEVVKVIKQLAVQRNATIIITESGADIDKILSILDYVVILYEGEILYEGSPRDIMFLDMLPRIGVRRPQVVDLFIKLREHYPELPIPLTVDEALKFFNEHLLTKVSILSSEDKIEKAEMTSSNQKSYRLDPIIEVRNLHHVYPPNIVALKGISLNVYPGSFVSIIGQNGSGKTTLALHLVGLLKPTNKDAKIIVDGIDVAKETTKEIIKHISYVFQNPDHQLFNETVIEEISYGLKNLKFPKSVIDKKVAEALKIFELEDYKFENPLTLPKHLRKRVAICSSLIMEPKILIVDEPTTGLDTREIKKLIDIFLEFKKKGGTLILISHDIETVTSYADELIVMSRGTILAHGSPKEVFSRYDVLKEASVQPPQVTQLGHSMGIAESILRVEEIYQRIVGVRECPS